MATLSARITTLNGDGSDGWDLFYRARQMAESGLDVIELTIGEHDIRTDPSILDAMDRAAKGGHTGYATVPGISGLRDAVAARLTERTGVPTTRDNVLITPGGQAALFCAHMAVLDPGDTALFIDPYYTTYPGVIRGASATPVSIQTHAENAFRPTRDAIETAARTTGARSLLVNSPNNPTGTVYPRDTLQDIALACQSQDLWLVSDEVYDTQVWDGTHISPRSLPGMTDRCLVIGSLSKSHAMTGSRIGWIVGPADATEHMIDLATSTTYGVPGFVQDAALFALSQGPDLEERVAAPFRRRRDLAMEIINRATNVSAIPAQGAMYLMLDIRQTGLSGEAFADLLLDTHHIAVMPGESFGASAAGHLRVALTVDDDRLKNALETLCAFAEGLAHAA